MTSRALTLLAIETSCDETGVAVLRQSGDHIEVVAQGLASQLDIHAQSGGVIPEVAAREHVVALQPLLRDALRLAEVRGDELDAIAVTVGPGLQPALAVGVQAARTLAYAWRKPVVPIHHLEGHLYSALLQGEPVFPALGLIVSGGHTQLILMRDHVTYDVIGTTQDDAAGEAFDKVARLLGLPYPGGPHLSKLAQAGNATTFAFPRPMLDSSDYHFSFSGLKTAVLYAWRELSAAQQQQHQADVAASFEAAVVEVLVHKTILAVQRYRPRVLLLAGGVAANQRLRAQIATAVAVQDVPLRIAPLELCGDNAVMIGQAALFAHAQGRIAPWSAIDAYARLPITQWQTPASA